MRSALQRHTLVVANRTASTPLLLEEVRRRAAERPTSFTLLIPTGASDWPLETALKSLRRAARGPDGLGRASVDGFVADADAFASIEQALAGGAYDDVIISTLPRRTSEWLRRDLPRRVERLGVPVTVITQPEDARSVVQRAADLVRFAGAPGPS